MVLRLVWRVSTVLAVALTAIVVLQLFLARATVRAVSR